MGIWVDCQVANAASVNDLTPPRKLERKRSKPSSPFTASR